MLKLIRRTTTLINVAAETDKVVAAMSIPADSRVGRIWLDQHVVKANNPENNVNFYGVTGYVVPVIDPDGEQTFDNIWDRQVPKDNNALAGSFDLDTTTVDTQPEFEIGELSPQGIFNIGSAPIEVFRRRKMLSVAEGMPGFDNTASTYTLTDTWKAQVNVNVKVDVPSALIIAFSSPAIVAASTVLTSIKEAEWVQLQYAQVTLQQAWMSLMGLTEATAETPYLEAQTLIMQFLERAAVNTVGDMEFESIDYDVVTRCTYELYVPGEPGNFTLTSEG